MVIINELLPIKKIEDLPTIHEGVHESIYRSYQILEHVETMLLRNDSKETILGFIDHFKEYPRTTTN